MNIKQILMDDKNIKNKSEAELNQLFRSFGPLSKISMRDREDIVTICIRKKLTAGLKYFFYADYISHTKNKRVKINRIARILPFYTVGASETLNTIAREDFRTFIEARDVENARRLSVTTERLFEILGSRCPAAIEAITLEEWRTFIEARDILQPQPSDQPKRIIAILHTGCPIAAQGVTPTEWRNFIEAQEIVGTVAPRQQRAAHRMRISSILHSQIVEAIEKIRVSELRAFIECEGAPLTERPAKKMKYLQQILTSKSPYAIGTITQKDLLPFPGVSKKAYTDFVAHTLRSRMLQSEKHKLLRYLNRYHSGYYAAITAHKRQANSFFSQRVPVVTNHVSNALNIPQAPQPAAEPSRSPEPAPLVTPRIFKKRQRIVDLKKEGESSTLLYELTPALFRIPKKPRIMNESTHASSYEAPVPQLQ